MGNRGGEEERFGLRWRTFRRGSLYLLARGVSRRRWRRFAQPLRGRARRAQGCDGLLGARSVLHEYRRPLRNKKHTPLAQSTADCSKNQRQKQKTSTQNSVVGVCFCCKDSWPRNPLGRAESKRTECAPLSLRRPLRVNEGAKEHMTSRVPRKPCYKGSSQEHSTGLYVTFSE